jgi:PadR family transcriptional regulator, regulatory protein PadR
MCMTHIGDARTEYRTGHHGHRRRQGVQGQEACPRRIQRFLEPCLLLLLHRHEIHGYELLDSLHPFGFAENPVDSSTVYRLLRSLEERGFITSRWDTSNAGPARRLYRLTAEGDLYLAWWAEELRETDRVLHSFLDTYHSHMAAHHGQGKRSLGTPAARPTLENGEQRA